MGRGRMGVDGLSGRGCLPLKAWKRLRPARSKRPSVLLKWSLPCSGSGLVERGSEEMERKGRERGVGRGMGERRRGKGMGRGMGKGRGRKGKFLKKEWKKEGEGVEKGNEPLPGRSWWL